MKVEPYFETSGNNDPSTQGNKPEELSPYTQGVPTVLRKYRVYTKEWRNFKS
jgi:hypothetical protein